MLRGQGDQWDNRARSRGVTASFSLNGIGLMPEEAPDLYQENEELKVANAKSLIYANVYSISTPNFLVFTYNLFFSKMLTQRMFAFIKIVIIGGNPKTGSTNRIYEDSSHGNEQQTRETKNRWVF